jgi:hypothetical protein
MCFLRASSRFAAFLLLALFPALSLADDSKSQEERLSQMTFEEILNIKVVTPSKVSEFARCPSPCAEGCRIRARRNDRAALNAQGHARRRRPGRMEGPGARPNMDRKML